MSSLAIYEDVREVADLVLAHHGGEYECHSHGAAVHFTHRFYRFRKLYRKTYHADGSRCKYDQIIVPRVKPDSATIKFKLRQHVGTFKPAGRPAVDVDSDDELFNIASQIRKRLQQGDKE